MTGNDGRGRCTVKAMFDPAMFKAMFDPAMFDPVGGG
jgi:hypothetical protein